MMLISPQSGLTGGIAAFHRGAHAIR